MHAGLVGGEGVGVFVGRNVVGGNEFIIHPKLHFNRIGETGRIDGDAHRLINGEQVGKIGAAICGGIAAQIVLNRVEMGHHQIVFAMGRLGGPEPGRFFIRHPGVFQFVFPLGGFIGREIGVARLPVFEEVGVLYMPFGMNRAELVFAEPSIGSRDRVQLDRPETGVVVGDALLVVVAQGEHE